MSLYARERPEFLRQSLDSVFNQTLKPSEIILVEDGPLTPVLDAIVEEYKSLHPEIKVVALPENGGLGKALNEGLKHCSYELVARMDTDDMSYPDRFEKQVGIFMKYPQVEAVSAWIEEFDSDTGEKIAERKLPEFPYQIYRYGKKRCPVNHPVVMFKRKTVMFAGGYMPFPLFEDYYLWVRMLMNGAKFYNVQESLLHFRTSPDMYRRRGGLRHALNEVRFQNTIRKMGYIGIPLFLFNIFVRFFTRIVPNHWRAWIYRKLLRR